MALGCGIGYIYGYMLGIGTFVIIWALKKLTIRDGIKEVMKENKKKEKRVIEALDSVEKAKKKRDTPKKEKEEVEEKVEEETQIELHPEIEIIKEK